MNYTYGKITSSILLVLMSWNIGIWCVFLRQPAVGNNSKSVVAVLASLLVLSLKQDRPLCCPRSPYLTSNKGLQFKELLQFSCRTSKTQQNLAVSLCVLLLLLLQDHPTRLRVWIACLQGQVQPQFFCLNNDDNNDGLFHCYLNPWSQHTGVTGLK